MKILKEEYLDSSNIEEGLLGFAVEVFDKSEIYDFSYFINIRIQNKISLGIAITHFNRQQYVLAVMERLKKELI